MEILTAILFASFLSEAACSLVTGSSVITKDKHFEHLKSFSIATGSMQKSTCYIRPPSSRSLAWAGVSENHQQGHQNGKEAQRHISKAIRPGMGLRDSSPKLSEWPRVSGTQHQSCQSGLRSGAQHQGHQHDKGIRNPNPTFLLGRKR